MAAILRIGDIITIDGVECTIFSFDLEKYWAVDNHGMSYYQYGVEEDETDYNTLFQWGADNIVLNVSGDDSFGSGLAQSNAFLAIPECLIADQTRDSPITIWKALSDIRTERGSNRWFIPTAAEWKKAREYFNVTDIGYLGTWLSDIPTSSEYGRFISGEEEDTKGYTRNYNYYCKLICTFTADEVDIDGKISISNGRDTSEIHYTEDESDPDESSSLYTEPISVSTGDIIKAIAYEELHVPSDIASVNINLSVPSPIDSIELGTELADGIVCYDRGKNMGAYGMEDNLLFRLSEGVDTEDYNSDWRFLIMDKSDLPGNDKNEGNKPFCSRVPLPISTGYLVGYGLQNTNELLKIFSNDHLSFWPDVLQKRNLTGKKWFVPTYEEYEEVSNFLQGVYLSSSIGNYGSGPSGYRAQYYDFTNGTSNGIKPSETPTATQYKVRLMYRV